MKKGTSYLFVLGFCLFISLIHLACKKEHQLSGKSRLTNEFKKSLEKIGRLHNTGLSKMINEHPEWGRYFSKPYTRSKTSAFSMSRTLVRKTFDTDTWEDIGFLTRQYFLQLKIDSLPEFSVPLLVLDSISTFTDDFWLAPDSAVVARLNAASPVTLSSYFNYLVQELFDAMDEQTDPVSFASVADNLVENADYNLTENLEFYSFAVCAAIAKKSFEYWSDTDNFEAWQDFVTEHYTPLSMRSSLTQSDSRALMLEWERSAIKRMLMADARGAVTGGIIGGYLGSIGGPAGTVAGVVGGGFVSGVEASAMSGAWSMTKHFFGW